MFFSTSVMCVCHLIIKDYLLTYSLNVFCMFYHYCHSYFFMFGVRLSFYNKRLLACLLTYLRTYLLTYLLTYLRAVDEAQT